VGRTKHKMIIPSLIWLFAICAALLAAHFREMDIAALAPLTIVGSIPAFVTLALSKSAQKEWAQIIIIFAWAGLAAFAAAGLGFVPMVLMFVCPLAVAMLFQREKLLESMIISVLIGGVIFYADREGYIPAAPFSFVQQAWGQVTGLAASFALLISAMFMSANTRQVSARGSTGTRWRDGVEGGLFEFSASGDLLGANPLGQTQFEAHFDKAVQTAKETRKKQIIRLSWPNKDNYMMSYDLRVTPLLSGGILLHTTDRSDEETRIEQLRRTQATALRDSQDKTLFFAGVSHELRTPLNAIIGFSDMMRSRLFGPLPNKYAEYADLIHDSGQHMLDLIGDVLDISKADAGKYELNYTEFDAADVVRSSVKMVRPSADKAEVNLHIEMEDDTSYVLRADRRAVRQILLNLLSNAIKFTNSGGTVQIGARLGEGQQSGLLILFVNDNGIGMSTSDLDFVAQPYQQGTGAMLVSERGTGLGLNLVQSLAELHGGKMQIESLLGEGTQVTIQLPVEPL